MLRVRFSNAFGRTPLALASAHIARSAGGGAIRRRTDKPLTFRGRPSIEIPARAVTVSDPLPFHLPPLSDLAVTVHLRQVPTEVTGHPDSGATSYLESANVISSADLTPATRVDHWYFLNGVDVVAGDGAAAVATLGDSITNGRGSTTNGNDRWPDDLARRLNAGEGTAEVAVVNEAIGGNRLLRDRLGPSALARLDSDVLALPGVRWLIILEGINDLGARAAAGTMVDRESVATADEIIAAYRQIVARAHACRIRVYGATLLPFEGARDSFTLDGEADRRKVNDWIRTSRAFDGVIDFDAVTRDPSRPSRLSPMADGGDHLHPSAAGYAIMADSIDLRLFMERGAIP
jgi:lysophospholipase L1-like esterase